VLVDLFIPLDRRREQPLRDQLYAGLRSAIVDGRLALGDRLPASRALATSLGISRFTVDDAYSRLISDGYVEGRHGSGTFVAYDAPAKTTTSTPAEAAPVAERAWSRWADGLPPARHPDFWPIRYAFKQGVPALEPFPIAVWRHCQTKAGAELSEELRFYGSPRGYRPLREAIADYLTRARMLACSPDEVVITSGTQQALDLLSRLFLDPGDRVAVEEPGYPTSRRAVQAAGAELALLPVDADGLIVEGLAAIPAPKMLYVTPSHQFPTGGVLPLARRRVLLDEARARGMVIVEDDYDSEFRYGQRPVEPLAALDRSLPGPGAVIYLGTFSKVLYPSLRLGYMVLPADVIERVLAAKDIADRHPSTLEQATVAAFIAEGHFERHLARMRRVYASRLSAMLEALTNCFGSRVSRDPASTDAGLHILAQFDVSYDESELVRRASSRQVLIDPAGPCYLTPPTRPAALLGYAAMDEARIVSGIAELAKALLN
jgi:GntR family transcriptional regulator/MocR family aminotransferase